MKWEKVRLEDCCYSISDGDHQPPPKAQQGIPFVTISNINSMNQLDFSDTMFVPKEYYQSLDEKRKVRKGDVLYSVVGSFGIPVLIKEERPFVFQRHIAILRPKEDIVDSGFLFYTMLNRDFYAKADAVAIGAAQRTVSLGSLRNIKIDVPSLESQKHIADILSAYDDLIENNQKQIKLLEEAAQRIYKEWFVDLRFPGHENTKIVDGVPEEWTRNPIQDFISYEIGGGWGEELQNEKSMIPAYVIRGTDIKGLINGQLQSVPYRYHTAGSLETRKLLDGDIVFEVSGGSKTEGVARTVRIIDLMLKTWENSVICASFCKRVKPIPNFSQYLYDSFRWMRLNGKTQEYDKKSASSIVNYRWKDFLAQEKILKPDEETISQYNNIAGTIYTKIIVCSCQIEQAKMKRDLLLPKLMSGELEV